MPISEVKLMDNMEYMGLFPDKFFPLAVCDPPYGINVGNMKMGAGKGYRCSKMKNRKWLPKDWDLEIPPDEYFDELFRVSENQIIWGGNYFSLPPSQYFAIWDKGEGLYGRSFAECEYAWVSNGGTRIFKVNPVQKERISPTQKPIELYKGVLESYAKEGYRILDTNVGSQSSRIAAYRLGFDFYGCDNDEQIFNEGNARFEREINGVYVNAAGEKKQQHKLF